MTMNRTISVVFLALLLLIASRAGEGFAQESTTPSYQIGPSDVLRVFVWKETELTQDLTVMPDGRITFPLIGEIEAQGRTVTNLTRVISEKLKKYVTAPEVTVIVRESNSRPVFTIGKVTKPGPYPLGASTTVLQALSMAGGLAEWADEKNIRIVRRENGKEIQLPFNYKDCISGRNPEQNILLKPHDTIVVP